MRNAETRKTVWCLAEGALAVWLAAYMLVFVSSEALSACGAFRPGWIRTLWAIAAVGVGFGLWVRRSKVRLLAEDVRQTVRWPRTFIGWCLAAAATLTLVNALLAPSSAQDALVYHLPRATHWLVNGSTHFYETAIFRQNFQAQGFSLCVAHLLAVCGGDRLVNLLQWGSWWLLGGTAGLVAAELGAKESGKGCAALLAITLPQAVAQSTQAISDLFAAVPLLAFGLYVLRMGRRSGRQMARWTVAAAMALGLACVARQTGLIYGAILGVTLGVCLLMQRCRAEGARCMAKLMAALGLAALIGVSCAIPQMVRNWRAYGDLFSGEPQHAMTVEGLTPKLFAVNLVKHAATQLSLPTRILNKPIERVVREGCGAAVDDPRIHYGKTVFLIPFRIVSTFGKDAALVTNPLHAILFSIVGVGWLVRWRRAGTLLSQVAVPVAGGALLYCALFKWQLWAVRLTIPLYGWMAAGVGVWLGDHWARRRRAVLAVLAAASVAQAALRPVWFMPAFLYGEGTAESGITRDMTVADKVRRLKALGWPANELERMAKTVPEVERDGYSLFYTARQRQYLGNENYRNASWRYGQLEEALRAVERLREAPGVSRTLGLLVASDHSNLPPEVRREPFPNEYPLWTWGGGEAARGDWRWEHFGASVPAERAGEIFGAKRGVILSDKTRESVVEQLRQTRSVTLAVSNALFNVYRIDGI